MRKVYIDNIRWGTVVLVLIYHVFFLFNTVGIVGDIGNSKGIAAFDMLSSLVYPWFMVLLFLIAGISARYTLQKKSSKQFLIERVTKLLVPSTLGLFVYHWIAGYLNIKIGGAIEFMPSFLIFPISAISGIGPLWFIQTLFLFSLLLVLIRKIDHKEKLWNLGGKANVAVILLLAVPIWGAAQVLNMPLLTMYRFGIYGLAFFLGYFIFSHDSVQDTVEKMRVTMLILAVIFAVCYSIFYLGKNYTTPECLQSLLTNIYLWVVILAILGCGKAWLGGQTKFTAYMTKASFGLYILHYPIVLGVCYLLTSYLKLPVIWNYIIALIAELVLTPMLYELLRRIPVIRYLVLGIKGDRSR